MNTFRLLQGDCTKRLAELEPESVRTCVTSPPYWGLRDYGEPGQIGLEVSPLEYVAKLVDVFRAVRRVLRPDGTLWLNLGDSYVSHIKGSTGRNSTLTNPTRQTEATAKFRKRGGGLKDKDLVGIPWRVAFALQEDGWYLRSDIIWAKPNPMPESVEDRPTRAHEYVFLLARSERYFYDAEAVKEAARSDHGSGVKERKIASGERGRLNTHMGSSIPWERAVTRNRRSVWTISAKPLKSAHFAVMPPDLVEPCVLAGSAHRDEVLDPFCGSGTVGVVALRHGRNFVGVDLSPEYLAISRRRITHEAPLLTQEVV